jgi:U3 small nucleolar RNA-associated protein 5
MTTSLRATTPNLSVLNSIQDLDSFMTESSQRELNDKFLLMLREFQQQQQQEQEQEQEQKKDIKVQMNKTQRGFSLSQILSQSLQNGDKQMLETALCVSSAQHAKVLQVSLMRLPAPMVLPLLEAISKRITLKPRRALHLLPWLKNLLLCHASHLSTLPSASKLLAPLQQSIQDRLVALNPMQKLAGKLELILKQAELREMVKTTFENFSEEPLAIYDESEEDDESESEDDESESEDDESIEESNDKEMDESFDDEDEENESFDDDEEDDESFDDEDMEDDYE